MIARFVSLVRVFLIFNVICRRRWRWLDRARIAGNVQCATLTAANEKHKEEQCSEHAKLAIHN